MWANCNTCGLVCTGKTTHCLVSPPDHAQVYPTDKPRSFFTSAINISGFRDSSIFFTIIIFSLSSPLSEGGNGKKVSPSSGGYNSIGEPLYLVWCLIISLYPGSRNREEEEESLVSTMSGSGYITTYEDMIWHCTAHLHWLLLLYVTLLDLRATTITTLQFEAPTMLCMKSNTKGSVWKHTPSRIQ